TNAELMSRLFRADPTPLGNAPPQPAIYPRGASAVVRPTPGGAREITPMHWGSLMPQISKKTGAPILPAAINTARDDKLLASPFWRDSARERRCLLPASAFCEAKGRQPATYHWFGVLGEDGQ